MFDIRWIYLLLLFISLAGESEGFTIFKTAEEVLNKNNKQNKAAHSNNSQRGEEEPGKVKNDPKVPGFRMTEGELPDMEFLFDYDVEPDHLSMEFNLTKPNLEDESFSTMVHSCLLTPNGIEYEGRMYYTASHNVCINWNHPLLYKERKIKPFESKDFPDESITNAGSYCRNPDNSPTPWCFRKDNKKRENCLIPYCERKKCILTGPGIEYRGILNMSTYGLCEQWSFDVPFEKNTSAKAFPVKNYCRNPTFDPAGPYCYVHRPYHDNGTYPWLMKSYCDIPLCDIYFTTPSFKGELYFRKRGPYVFCAVGGKIDYYTHYTLFETKRNALNISLKLWNPATVFKDEIKIVLSVLAIPANSSEFLRWDMGFEIVLSNNQTGVIVNPPEDSILIPVPGLLSGIRWTHLTLEWNENGINVNFTHEEESTSIYQFREPNLPDTIRGLFQNRLQYISVLGSATLMRIMISDGECEEQITTEEVYARFYPFFRDGPVRKLQFAVKSTLPCFLLMRVSPLNISLAEVVISLDGRSNSQLILHSYENITHAGREFVEEILQEVETLGEISPVDWTYFSLSLRGSQLRVSMHSPIGSRYIFDWKNIHFTSLRYFSIASVSVAHWTLGCSPEDIKSKLFQPFGDQRIECSYTPNDLDYMGQISVSEKGRACLPWISDFVTIRWVFSTIVPPLALLITDMGKQHSGLNTEYLVLDSTSGPSLNTKENLLNLGEYKPVEKMFVDKNTYEAVNYCRNVIELYSAYCYVYDRLANRTVKRENCAIPKCEAEQCRAYGTGVGNILNITTTISGRECKYWRDTDEEIKAMFHVDENASELKKHLLDIEYSENFCRNPNNDIAGPWCCTTDPNTKIELCDVPDCDRPLGTITLLTTNVKHETYIKPMWRVTGWKFWFKRWERKTDAGLMFKLLSPSRTEYFQIIFEGKNTSKVLLVYVEEQEEPVEVEAYSPYDFFLFIPNNWTGYCLTIKKERLTLGIIGEKSPFLNWEYSIIFERLLGKDPSYQFTPLFLTYEKFDDGVMAMSFDPEDPFVEIMTSEDQGTYYPITYGKKENLFLPADVIKFHFRGNGNVLISFYNTIWRGPEMTINLGSGELKDRLLSIMFVNGKEIALAVNRTDGPTFLDTKWTGFRISVSEVEVTVYCNDDEFSTWRNPKPFLPYYFKLQTSGNITWIANTDPPEIDSKAINGGWSEWTSWDCSVTCGGGRGYRKRTCTSPPPSLFGLPCPGEPMEYGLCNPFECGDLPPDIIEAITFRMKRYVYTQAVYEHTDSIIVNCYPDILDLIQQHSPDYMVYWDKNGEPITNRTPIGDIETDRYSWFKMKAELSDSGVYSCAIDTPLVDFRPVQITSLIVKTVSSYTFIGYKGELFKFHSNNKVLSWLYKDLELVWLHDGKVSDRYSEIYLPLMNTKEITLEMDDTGEWECTIRQRKFNMKWHTNWVKIKVEYRNDFVKYLMDDNQYTRYIFKDFKPLFVEIAFVILVLITAVISTGVAFILVHCQRILRRQWKELYRAIQDKLRGESPYQGNLPHTSSEENNSDSSLSSGYNRYIQKESEPTIYYITDENVSDSADHLGFKSQKKRRKILRDAAPLRRRRRLSRSSKREKSHKNSNVRRPPVKIINLPRSMIMMRREEEARRDHMFPDSSMSSSTSNSVYNYDPDPFKKYSRSLDLLNYKLSAGKAIETIPNETQTSGVQKRSHLSRNLNLCTDELFSFSSEEQSENSNDKENTKPSPFKNFAGKSQFSRKRYVPGKKTLYRRQISNDDSEFSLDSDSYTFDAESLILASTDS